MGSQNSKTNFIQGQEYEKRLLKIFKSQDLKEIGRVNSRSLNGIWGDWMNCDLVSLYSDYLEWKINSPVSSTKSPLPKDQLVFLKLHDNLVLGDLGEIASTLVNVIDPAARDKIDLPDALVSISALSNYVSYLLESALTFYEYSNSKAYKGWIDVGATKKNDTLTQVSQYMIKDIVSPSNKVGKERLECWLFSSPFFLTLQSYVLDNAFQYERHESKGPTDLLPIPEFSKKDCSMLDLYHVLYLNSWLPSELRNKWRLLYSTSEFGESWTIFLKCIVDQGPTYIIIKDSDGAVFGGFASVEWSTSPHFFGNNLSFLFTLEPVISKCDPTNYNANFQYVNTGQTTFPNGLGMGGQLDFWGIYIDSSMTSGSTAPSCSTYSNFKQPSPTQNFKIDIIEVWGVGDKPVKVDEEGERSSALDSQVEAKAMLEMMGRSQVSEGLREPPKELTED